MENNFRFSGTNPATARGEYVNFMELFYARCQLLKVDYVLRDESFYHADHCPALDEDDPEEPPDFVIGEGEVATVADRIAIQKLNQDKRRDFEKKLDKYNERFKIGRADVGVALSTMRLLLKYGDVAYTIYVAEVDRPDGNTFKALRAVQAAFEKRWSSKNEATKAELIEKLRTITDESVGDWERFAIWANITAQLDRMGELPSDPELLQYYILGIKNEFVRSAVIVPHQMMEDSLKIKE